MDPASDRSPETSIAARYLAAQRSFAGFARSLSGADWAMPAPCCPGWRVRDILSHVTGIVDDVLNGRIDGVATEPWTARQVERWRDAPVDELLARWDARAPEFAELVEALGEERPPADCHTHEFDARQALGRPGDRDGALVRIFAARLAEVPTARALTIVLADGRRREVGGDGAPIELRGLTEFELLRSRLGRRSAAQVRAYDWSEPPDDDLLAAWFAFGPAAIDVVE